MGEAEDIMGAQKSHLTKPWGSGDKSLYASRSLYDAWLFCRACPPSAHRFAAGLQLAQHKGQEDAEQPAVDEPPPHRAAIRLEFLHDTQSSWSPNHLNSQAHCHALLADLTFNTRPLTFSSCWAAWSQSRVVVRHWSASCRKVVTASAMSCGRRC